MTDSEKMDLLLEKMVSMEKKVDSMERKVERIDSIEMDIRVIKADIENEVKPNIQLLAENYVPAAKKYVEAAEHIENIESDVDILKKVVAKHSEKLQQLA